jgi:hypothetical protein
MTTNDPTRLAGLLFGWGFGGIATFIGLAGVLLTAWNIKQDRASESWPLVTGKIITSRIGSSTTHSSRGGASKMSSSDTDYSVELRYIYEVEGQTYQGHRLRFGSNSHDKRSDAQKEQRQFPEGKKVPVYYNPEKPGRSVLVRGTSSNWGQLIGLSICLLVGLTALFFTIRSTIRKPDVSSVQ